MIENRSAPPGPIVPTIDYQDVSKAIDWLSKAFGFSERLRTSPESNGSVHHAQLACGAGCVILTSRLTSQQGPPANQDLPLMIRVENIDQHCARAQQFGAHILMPPDTKPFGERQYAAADLEGNRWVFTESVADVPPEEWGAHVADISPRLATLPKPRVCYLQIPTLDAHRSADFYHEVFGWRIRHRDSSHPSFDDAGGNVSGGWFPDLWGAREPAILISIWVDNLSETLARVAAHGGEVVKTPEPDSPGSTSWIAHFRDLDGHLIGLYQENRVE